MAAFITYAEYKAGAASDYQLNATVEMIRKPRYCLFFDPGKGKTYPVLDALFQLTKNEHPVLILSTAMSINDMWHPDIASQGIFGDNVCLMSYDVMRQSKTFADVLSIPWEAIICDECHKLKDKTTLTFRCVNALTKRAKYVFGLSGTPIMNTEYDLMTQLACMNFPRWDRARLATEVYTSFNSYKTPYGVEMGSIKPHAKERFYAEIAEFAAFKAYDEEEETLKPLNRVSVPFAATDLYRNAEEGFMKLGEFETTFNILAAAQKCQQIANGFVYYQNYVNPSASAIKDRMVARANIGRKLDLLVENVRSRAGEPQVVVYKFNEDCEILHERLPEATRSIAAFKEGKSTVLLIQCSRADSINLTHSHCMHFYTYDFSYGNFYQMCRRTARRGQPNMVDIFVYVYEGSVEEDIYSAIVKKKKLSDSLRDYGRRIA